MRVFRIKITADKYPTEYNVQATNFATAVARAIKEWRRRFKGSRATQLNIVAIKSTDLLNATDHE